MATIYTLPSGAQFMLDEKGISDILKSRDMQAVMADAANKLAAELLSRGVDRVWVDTYTTDRGAAAVTIPDYTDGHESKYGILSDAAIAVGLEVKEKAGGEAAE